MDVRDLLKQLLEGRTLSEQTTSELFESMFAGELDEPQIAGVLTLMQQRGVTPEELHGAAIVMRRHVTPVPIPESGTPVVIDTCGTGGAPKTFNVSTAAALVVAGAAPGKVWVAKHGNRSRTGRGSAELLTRLGVNVDAPPETQASCLEEAGVCFCFAIHHHPAAKHAAGVRRSLAFPTIFNLLGPLTNPARASRQLIGIYDERLVKLMGETLARLGSERASVVHSFDGLDEVSLSDRTHVARVEGGSVSREVIDPKSVGIDLVALSEVQAEDLDEAVSMIEHVLEGEPGPAREMVAINAGAALEVAGAAASLAEGLAMAREAIDSGAATHALRTLANVSHQA